MKIRREARGEGREARASRLVRSSALTGSGEVGGIQRKGAKAQRCKAWATNSELGRPTVGDDQMAPVMNREKGFQSLGVFAALRVCVKEALNNSTPQRREERRGLILKAFLCGLPGSAVLNQHFLNRLLHRPDRVNAELRTSRRSAFTLIELMVVIGILGIIMTIAIPSIYQSLHQDSMRKAVSDVMEACANARAQAILNGVTMELRIRPQDRQFSISTGPVEARPAGNAFGFGEGAEVVERVAPASSGFSVKLSDRIIIEGLGVNGEDWTLDEEAAVRFYPNGTSDEMSIVLYSPSSSERRNITLEVVTAMADMEADVNKFKAR